MSRGLEVDVSEVKTGRRGERTWYVVYLVWFEIHGDVTTESCILVTDYKPAMMATVMMITLLIEQRNPLANDNAFLPTRFM